mgnify:CR=1 FL=1
MVRRRARHRLSKRAAADVARVAHYTIEQFGVEQARRYRDGLDTCFQRLAENAELGRTAGQLAPNLRRFEYQSHVVFYMPDEGGILIVRVLHERMDVQAHLW